VQYDPIKPTVKAPETKLLNLENNEVLSVLHHFNSRRYMMGHQLHWEPCTHLAFTQVGQCSLTLSNPS